MKVDMTFQYMAPGAAKPDAITLSDVATETEGQPIVPNMGDIITDGLCWPSDQRGHYRSFKVIGKNYVYARQPGPEGFVGGPIIGCSIYVIVTDVDDKVPGVVFRE